MYFENQYSLVKSAREELFNYCKTLSPADFVKDNSIFGKGSIRNLLVHIGNTYESWVGKRALNKNLNFTQIELVTSATEAEDLFFYIDSLMEEFISIYTESDKNEIEMIIEGKLVSATPMKLFTHVIMHEFHHKGQILSLSRLLGYIPVDTDILRY